MMESCFSQQNRLSCPYFIVCIIDDDSNASYITRPDLSSYVGFLIWMDHCITSLLKIYSKNEHNLTLKDLCYDYLTTISFVKLMVFLWSACTRCYISFL